MKLKITDEKERENASSFTELGKYLVLFVIYIYIYIYFNNDFKIKFNKKLGTINNYIFLKMY